MITEAKKIQGMLKLALEFIWEIEQRVCRQTSLYSTLNPRLPIDTSHVKKNETAYLVNIRAPNLTRLDSKFSVAVELVLILQEDTNGYKESSQKFKFHFIQDVSVSRLLHNFFIP